MLLAKDDFFLKSEWTELQIACYKQYSPQPSRDSTLSLHKAKVWLTGTPECFPDAASLPSNYSWCKYQPVAQKWENCGATLMIKYNLSAWTQWLIHCWTFASPEAHTHASWTCMSIYNGSRTNKAVQEKLAVGQRVRTSLDCCWWVSSSPLNSLYKEHASTFLWRKRSIKSNLKHDDGSY